MILTATLLALTPAVPPTTVQDQEELLGLYIVEGDHLLRHPKDRGLAAVLSMVDNRIAELPNEIPDFELPPAALPLITRMLVGSKTLRIMRDNQGAGVPIAAELAMHEGGAEAATAMNSRTRSLLEMLGAPIEGADANGMTAVPVPAPMPIMFGPVGNDMKLLVGNPVQGQMDLGLAKLPGGIAPDMAIHLNYGGSLELFMEFMAMQSPDEAEMMDLMFNSVGIDQMDIHIAYGADNERSYTTTLMPGYGAVQKDAGLLPDSPLSAAELNLVPADASWAMVTSMNVQGTFDNDDGDDGDHRCRTRHG